MGKREKNDGDFGGWVVPDVNDDDNRISWSDLTLRVGDVISLRTRNTNYRLRVVDVERQTVEVTSDGSSIPGPEMMTFMGSRLSPTGSMIRMGIFVIGLWVELVPTSDRQKRYIAEGRGPVAYVLTSSQELCLNDVRILPIGGKA